MERTAERQEAWTALAVYGLLVAVGWLWGYRMEIPWHYYQVLPEHALAHRLSESLLYLHAQPPLLNLLLGLVLKVSQQAGIRPEILLLVGHVGAGGVAVYGYARLCQRMLRGRWLRRIAIALFVLHPVLYMSLFSYFYSFHELVIFALLPLPILAYAQSGQTISYMAICFGVVLLAQSHSLFHLAFGLTVLVALPLLARPRGNPGHFSPAKVAWLFASLVLLLAWPLKNGLIFGSFAASSWTGYSLALELPVDIDTLPARNWEVPEKFAAIPVLTQRAKRGGAPNWNHHSIIAHSRNQGELARATVLDSPGSLGRKALLNYWNYTRFSGRNPYSGAFGNTQSPIPKEAESWMWAYEKFVFLDPRDRGSLAHRAYRSPSKQSWDPGLFTFALPVILIAAGWQIARRFRSDRSRSVTALFMLFSASWVLLATLLVDGSEANRIRFSTEPYLVMLALFAIDSLHRRARQGTKTGGAT